MGRLSEAVSMCRRQLSKESPFCSKQSAARNSGEAETEASLGACRTCKEANQSREHPARGSVVPPDRLLKLRFAEQA